ncbi:unnamed protein product [Callosobruchus maculatus]|uniref:Nucleoside 2-deoxyribosyltransferase like protein n=1 Tax=Callosobruchus maculatus TaxID=64391 RepID=A0A653C7U8_CALMS|nr:unnamed protein product [Callosobruchus maculatus]
MSASPQGDAVVVGPYTREVYNAICIRLGDTLHIPEDSVQALFNDMKLYPSKSQVSRMLQCARQCGRRNGATSEYITFGEFCVFVREMQNQSPRQHRKITPPKSNRCLNRCDVFLGGSCNPTTWRTDTAIPELKKHGITFYNPQVSMWAPELVAQEYDAKQRAAVLLFVLDSETRSTVGMIEVAYLVASGRCVVVVAQPYERGQRIIGEVISEREYQDLVEAQNVLLDLVRSKGVKIHTNLSTALQCTANILRNSTNSGTSAEEQVTYKLRKLREVYDSYGGEMKLYHVLDAYKKLTNRSLDIARLYNYFNHTQSTNSDSSVTSPNSTVSFERFCALMAEFSSTDGCEMCSSDGRSRTGGARMTFQATSVYWTCALLKTRFLIRSIVDNALVWAMQPFQRQCSTTTNNNTCTLDSDSQHIECLLESPPYTPETPNPTAVDIFLGGSLTSKSKWRETIAVPLIEKHGLTYCNPAVREDGTLSYPKRDVLEWKKVMDASRIVLMYITKDSRSMTSIILAVYHMGLNKDNLVLCVETLPEDSCAIHDEMLSKNAVKDYNRARVYLTDLAKRKQVPVFENITEAVQCAVERCKGG